MIPENKTVHLTLRLNLDLRTKFRQKAKKYGLPSEVLREIILAFVDNRLTIQPPANTKEALYVTRK